MTISRRSYPNEPWAFVSPEVRAATRARYEHLAEQHASAFAMLDAWARNTARIVKDHVTEAAPHVQLPHAILNQCRGLKERAGDTRAFLEAYAVVNGLDTSGLDDDGTDNPEADFYGHKWVCEECEENSVRAMTTRHLPELDAGLSLLDRWKRMTQSEKVHIVTGIKQSKAPLPERRSTMVDDQRLVCGYFETRYNARRYMPNDAALAAAHAWCAENLTATETMVVVRQVGQSANTYPRVQPTERASTHRLFDGVPWQSMRSEVRRRLMPQWIELDLRAAYLATWVTVMENHGLYEHVPLLRHAVGEDGTGTWDRAREHLNAPHRVTKEQLKEFVYATLFGALKTTAEQKLLEAGVELADAQRINSSPLAKELRRSLRELLTNYRRRGFLWDAYDSKRKVVGGGAERASTLIHLVLSSYELRMVARAYEAALDLDAGGFIAVHSHDGVSVGHDDPQMLENYADNIAAAVNAEAERLNVNTRFVRQGMPPRLSAAAA